MDPPIGEIQLLQQQAGQNETNKRMKRKKYFKKTLKTSMYIIYIFPCSGLYRNVMK